jgi:hypothetical protein
MILAMRIGVETVTGSPSGIATKGWEKATISFQLAICVNFPHMA